MLTRLYAILAIGHILVQIVLGHIEFRRQVKHYSQATSEPDGKVSAIVPVYDEDPQIFGDCVRSLLNQEGVDLEVIVVEDGSPNAASHRSMLAGLACDRLRVIELPTNIG